MKTAAKRVLVIFLSAIAYSAQSVSPPTPQRISSEDLLADVAILRRAYEQLHPGLYRYNSREQMNANFNELARNFSHDQTLSEAYLAFSSFTAKIRCGHSYPNFFNQPKAVAETLFRGQNRLPFYFRWIDKHMIVTRSFTGDQRIRPGDEILAINGTSTSEILGKLLTIARADGSNDAKRIDLLNVTGDSEYETFDVYFPLFFPQPGTKIKLLVRNANETGPKLVEVTALTYEERLDPIREKVEGRRKDLALWTFKFLRADVAYLQMPDWALYDSKWNWQAFLEDVFTQLDAKKPSNFVIDLRGNEGGLDAGNPILSRLIDRDLPLEQYERRVRYRKVPDDLAPYLDTWDPSFKDWGDKAIDLHNGFFRLTRYDDDQRGEVLKPAGKKYSGKVWVLVDASNSSATFQFARVVQTNRLGILVGQPTGGNLRGINGGAFFFLRLPNSHIEVDLPLIGTFPITDQPDTGLRPDLLIALEPRDIAAGRNTVLEKVLQQSKP
jgi:C-terminal processing protease CtpA/Prc